MGSSDEVNIGPGPQLDFQAAATEVTNRPTAEVEPIRPEGSSVRSPGWSGTGDMVSEQNSANKMNGWVNQAGDRQAGLEAQFNNSHAEAATRDSAVDDLNQHMEKQTAAPAQDREAAVSALEEHSKVAPNDRNVNLEAQRDADRSWEAAAERNSQGLDR